MLIHRSIIRFVRSSKQEVLGAKPWAAETDDFRMGFLQGGGFSRVIQVFMAAPTGGEADSRDALLGHASALRILKMCLFYPPLGGVGVGGGVGTRAGGSRGGTRLAAGRVGGGGRGQGAGVGVGGGGEEVTLLVNRVMPGVAQPTPAARAAMQVSDSDLKQLLDKLVLVRNEYFYWGAGRRKEARAGRGVGACREFDNFAEMVLPYCWHVLLARTWGGGGKCSCD